MPRNQGTSRKGKPGKQDRMLGFGRTLQKATSTSAYVRPKANGKSRSGDGGMQPSLPTTTTNLNSDVLQSTKSVLELESVDDFLLQAELANAQFNSDRYGVSAGSAGAGGGGGIVVIDPTSSVYKPPVVTFQEDQAEQGASSTAATSRAAASSSTTDTFAFKELSVPRRPPWDASTTPSQLEEQEQRAFLEWRRSIAKHEEALLARQYHQQQSKQVSNNRAAHISVTPFEKNLQVWRQLWRVLERSSCVLLLVDARNPLFYLSEDLRDYATRELQTPVMVVVNKSDYLSPLQRKAWHQYLTHKGWDGICFFSAFEEQQQLDHQAQLERRQELQGQLVQGEIQGEGDDDDADSKNGDDDEDTASDDEKKGQAELTRKVATGDGPQEDDVHISRSNERGRDDVVDDDDVDSCPPLLSRQQLIAAMLEFADQHNCPIDPRYTTVDKDDLSIHHERIPFGLVGFPNVGKSSVINVLMGNSKHTHGTVKVGVAAQPGKTKHFQTLFLPGDGQNSRIVLCDCPGLVFPSFVSNTADLIASGVYPIAQMRDPYPVMELICQRIPRHVLNATYGIHLPEPTVLNTVTPSTSFQQQEDVNHHLLPPPPTAEELLDTYCHARGMLSASSGVPDVHRASRQIIHDYATGRLLYCHPPPPPSTNDSQAHAFVLSDDEYQQETLKTALRRTDKLRDKLLRQQQQQQEVPREALEHLDDDQELGEDDVLAEADFEDDQHLLDLLHVGDGDDASSSKGPSSSAALHKKHHKSGKKGKRGKKTAVDRARDADPYGCHDSPDDVLLRQAAAAASGGPRLGVGVKAGRYSRDAGYTRPSYAGARGAAATGTAPSATTAA